MIFRFFKKPNINAGIFNGHFVDAKVFYTYQFNTIPCITFIGDIDITKTYAFIKNNCKADITATYQHSYFNHDDKKIYFNNTIVILTIGRMIEIADNYCMLLHTTQHYTWAKKLVNDLSQFKVEREITSVPKPIHVAGFAKDALMN